MKRCLLFTADAAIRKTCFQLISERGYDLLSVSKQDKVIDILQSEKPDLVFLDIEPSAQEFSKVEKITKFFDTMPLIVIVSEISPEIEKNGFAAGAKEVLAGKNLKEDVSRVLNKILRPEDKSPGLNPSNKEDLILIVDDEEPIRVLLETFFGRKGHKTLLAKNGQEAVQLVREKKPTVVLLDVMMPGMNGIETLKKIREIDQEVGVVMATGVGDESVAREASKHGSYHYVLKPFDLKYLELVVLTRMALV